MPGAASTYSIPVHGQIKGKTGLYGSYYPADKLCIPHSKLFT